jgi:hypothetical protein
METPTTMNPIVPQIRVTGYGAVHYVTSIEKDKVIMVHFILSVLRGTKLSVDEKS